MGSNLLVTLIFISSQKPLFLGVKQFFLCYLKCKRYSLSQSYHIFMVGENEKSCQENRESGTVAHIIRGQSAVPFPAKSFNGHSKILDSMFGA